MPHDLNDVQEKLKQAVHSFTKQYVAQRIGAAELRLSQNLANAGYPKLAVEQLSASIAELRGRVEILENP